MIWSEVQKQGKRLKRRYSTKGFFLFNLANSLEFHWTVRIDMLVKSTSFHSMQKS
jgi:hypothetical protein